MTEVVGWEQFITTGERLQHVDVRRALDDAINHGAQPLPERLRASALATLPKRGGLAEAVARSQIRVSGTTGADAGARVTVDSRYNVAGLDAGRVVHPLFGDRRHWYSERVNPRWFTTPVEAAEPGIEREVRDAMERVKQEAEG